MWQKACELVKPSIAVIIRKTVNDDRLTWRTVGTAFQISDYPQPTFMTCAHVLVNGHGKENFEHAIFSSFGKTDGSSRGIKITHISLDLDIAIFVSDEGAKCKNILGFSDSVLEMGTSIAAIGFPNPKSPELFDQSGGRLQLRMRFSAGYISSNDTTIRLPQTLYTLLDLKHYEMNMFSYPGLSGAPVFDLEGNIFGMVRGTDLTEVGQQYSTASCYSYANRSIELYEYAVATGRMVIMPSPKVQPKTDGF